MHLRGEAAKASQRKSERQSDIMVVPRDSLPVSPDLIESLPRPGYNSSSRHRRRLARQSAEVDAWMHEAILAINWLNGKEGGSTGSGPLRAVANVLEGLGDVLGGLALVCVKNCFHVLEDEDLGLHNFDQRDCMAPELAPRIGPACKFSVGGFCPRWARGPANNGVRSMLGDDSPVVPLRDVKEGRSRPAETVGVVAGLTLHATGASAQEVATVAANSRHPGFPT